MRLVRDLSLLAIVFAATHAPAATYTVNTAADLSALPATLQAGDEVIIRSGTYANVNRKLTGTGTRANPVVVRAEVPGGAVFSGGTQFVLAGSGIVVSGLVFDGDIAPGGPRFSSGVFRLDRDSADMVIRDCRFNNYDTGVDVSGAFWILVNGYRQTIEYCSFERKMSEDPVINIIPQEDEGTGSTFPTRTVQRQHLIRHCFFGERTVIGENGYETIRVGESQYQMYDLAVIVEHCLFERAIYGPDVSNYEPEVISSKSRLNIYRDNTFRHNKGGLVLRHGDDNVVEGNFFFGEPGSAMGAGLRVIGLRHVIRNNHFQDIAGTGLRAALNLMKGSGEFPELSTSNGYETASFTRVFHNTFVDCEQPISLGTTTSSSGTNAPRGVEVRGNVVQSAAGRGPVLSFNSDNGFAISAVAFSDNFAWHADGNYGAIQPASGLAIGLPVELEADAGRGYPVPAQGSPVSGVVGLTEPPTREDIAGRQRPEGLQDAGAFATGADGWSWNRPLVRADVGPVFSGRSDPARAPYLVAQPPAAQAVYADDPVSLAVVVDHPGPVAVQWYRDGKPLAGATSLTLALPQVSIADAGVYTVAVSEGPRRARSFPTVLEVLPSVPVVVRQPTSQVIAPGEAPVFTVAAEGRPPLAVQWYRDGVPLAGASDLTLTLGEAHAALPGEYWAVIMNTDGMARTAAAELIEPGGTLLLADRFADGERATQALPASARWFSSSGTLSVTDGALVLPAGRHALAYLSDGVPPELPVGERLTATWTVTLSNAGTAAGGFRFGWFSSEGGTRPADGNNSGFTAYQGYVLTTTASFPDSNNQSTGPTVFRRRTPGAGGALLSTVGGIYTEVASGPNQGQSLHAGVPYQLVFTVARTATDTVRLSFAILGAGLERYAWSHADAAAPLTRYDAIALLSTSTNGSAMTIQQVTVERAALPAGDVEAAAWREAYFARWEATGRAADGADPDGDGWPNGLEFALGGHPRRGGDAGPEVAVREVDGTPYLAVRYPLNPAAGGTLVDLEASSDLESWTPLSSEPPFLLETETVGGREWRTVRDGQPATGGPRFVRVRVSPGG